MTSEVLQLREVCEFTYGDGLREDTRRTGNIPVYGSNGIVGWHDEAVTHGATIIIGRKGSIGEVNYSPSPCFPIDTTYYVEKTKKPCDLRWLYYALTALDLTKLNKSAAVPGLNRDDAYERRMVFPSLPEQRRIAALLDKADHLRGTRRYATQLSDAFLQAVFVGMFGDPARNPMGWVVESLGENIDSIRYGTGSPPEYQSDGVPFIRATNIKQGTIQPDGMAFISKPDAKKIAKCQVKEGNLIVVRSGVNAGDCAVIPNQYDGAYAAYDLIVELPYPRNIYYNCLINSNHGKAIIGPLTRRAGQPHLNADQIETLRCPLPPLALQQRFARIVQQFERLRAQQREAERQAEHLFQTLLHRAFSGEV